jgi:hypothetical protein
LLRRTEMALRTKWSELPADVRTAVATIRAKLTVAHAGFENPALFKTRMTALDKLREAIRLADGLMEE